LFYPFDFADFDSSPHSAEFEVDIGACWLKSNPNLIICTFKYRRTCENSEEVFSLIKTSVGSNC